MARITFCLGILLASAPASADWVVFKSGGRTQVTAVEIAERAVHITTLAGKHWSVLRETVDVDATVAANEPPAPLEVVSVADAPPIPAPAAKAPPIEAPPVRTPPPPSPAPPAPIVEREPAAPVLPPRDIVDTRAPPASESYRLAVTVNGVQAADTFALAESNQFELFKETASIDSVYPSSRRRGYELGLHYRVAGALSLGATAARFDNERQASYTASLPHPFFFERFRELSGAAAGLSDEELAIHLDVGVTHTWGPLTVDAFAGPSWFRTRTELLVGIDYDEIFPFDEVFFRGVEARVIESQPFGYNVGGIVTFRIAGILGVDLGARYSDARSVLFVEDGREIEVNAGGLNMSAGLRFLFP